MIVSPYQIEQVTVAWTLFAGFPLHQYDDVAGPNVTRQAAEAVPYTGPR